MRLTTMVQDKNFHFIFIALYTQNGLIMHVRSKVLRVTLLEIDIILKK